MTASQPRLTPSRRPGAPVRIAIQGGLARVGASAADIVKPLLQTITPLCERGGNRGYRLQRGLERQYVIRGGAIVFSPGVVPRLASELRRLGYRVEVIDKRHWAALRDADRSLCRDRDLPVEDHELLQALISHPRGVVVARRAADIPRMLTLLTRLLPKAHVVVVAANRKRLRVLRHRLELAGDRSFAADPEQVWPMPVRRYLCTLATFAYTANHRWQVIVFTDAESALARQSLLHAGGRMGGHLCYTFLTGGDAIGPRARLRIEQVCGPEIYVQPGAREVSAVVDVLVVDSPRRPQIEFTRNLDGKRALWHNAARNEAIARLANAFRKQDRRVLRRLGAQEMLHGGNARKVAVLVESVEHGRELLRYLPDWNLEHAIPDVKEVMEVRPAIRTIVDVNRWGIDADIIIRVDEGEGWPFPSAALVPHASGEPREILLVDVVGCSARGLRRRVEAYEKLGWRVKVSSTARESGQDGRSATGKRARQHIG